MEQALFGFVEFTTIQSGRCYSTTDARAMRVWNNGGAFGVPGIRIKKPERKSVQHEETAFPVLSAFRGIRGSRVT